MSSTHLTGVVSFNGSWEPFPVLSESLKKFFVGLSNEYLEKLILERCPTVSGNLSGDIDLLKKYLFGESELSYWEINAIPSWSHEIRYCPICIEEQKTEFGFSYFKCGWQDSYACKFHNIQLIRLVDDENICRCMHKGKGKAIFHKIESIISGVCRYCSKPIEPNDPSTNTPYYSLRMLELLQKRMG